MRELILILQTQLQFYRRHPLISALFLLGLCLGTALISAITHLNTEAGQRYKKASNQTVSPVHYLVKPIAGQTYLPSTLWFELRQQGIRQSQPVLTGRVQLEDGRSVLIRGINSLAFLEKSDAQGMAHQSTSFMSDSYNSSSRMNSNSAFSQLSGQAQFLIATRLASRLKLKTQAESTNTKNTQPSIRFKNSTQNYGYVTQDDIGPWLITDISVAHTLLYQQDRLSGNTAPISLIELGELTSLQYQQVKKLIGDNAELTDVSQQSFDALSESFFFNLTALALLGYAVGLFLSLNALKLMLSARNQMQTQLATLGCLPQRLQQALGIELILVCLCCAAIGNCMGFWIAQGLIFDVTTTLVNLYQLDRALEVHWQWQSFAVGLVMNLLALTALLSSLKLNQNNHQQKRLILRSPRLFLPVLLVIGSVIYVTADTKFEALLLCGWLIIVFSAITPPFLKLVSKRSLPTSSAFQLSKPKKTNPSPKASSPSSPLTQWLKANTSAHLQDVNLAVLAFLIALGAAIGTQVMVRSFALTLDTYLQQRLQADLYLRPLTTAPNFDAKHFEQLQQLPQVTSINSMEIAEATIADPQPNHANTLQIISYGNKVEHFQHLSRTDAGRITLNDISNGHCLANEPTALRYNKRQGDTVLIKQGMKTYQCRISGFYYDYGTQRINVVINKASLNASMFTTQFIGYGLKLNEAADTEDVVKRLIQTFNYNPDSIIQNAAYKRLANTLFSSTFAVTEVLNTLIVAIALIAIWVSFISMNQQQKNQFGIIQALGVTPTQLFWGQLKVTSGLLVLTLLLAIPLGISLGHVLLKFVMPISFGWSMPMIIDWTNIAKLCAIILLIAFSVSGVSIWKLQKQPIADLIKEKL